MLRIVSVLGLLLPLSALAQEAPPKKPQVTPQQTSHVCLRPSDVANTVIVDDETILFHMKGGKIWQNKLESACFGLRIEGGFSYVLWGDAICGNQQKIRVLRSASTCFLGPFTPYIEPPAVTN